ncbi:MAG: transposase, partial [Pseudomonadota bacterium]|nr:transposase [Pseudomonadota bacterium]
RGLFGDVLGEDLLARIRESVNGGFVLGNDRFEREIAAMLGRRTWKGSPGRPKKPAPDARQAEMAV